MHDPSHKPDPDTGELTPVEAGAIDVEQFGSGLVLGEVIDNRYEIRGMIGQGGLGVVYDAHDRRVGRRVAVKFTRHPESPARFAEEVRILALLDHPNILPLYDQGEVSGQPYCVTKLLPGGTLARWVYEARTSTRRVVEVVRKVAGAVQHLHDKGVLHLNLKPRAVLFDADGEPVVGSFGIAKRGSEDDPPGMLRGTPLYMAPEACSYHGVQAPSVKTDVWGLGVMLYELLTGQFPFGRARSFEEQFRCIHTEAPRPFREYGLPPGADQALEAVVMKCLEKDPANRYQSAGALAEDLQRWSDGERPLAAPQPTLLRSLVGLWRWPSWFKRAAPTPAVSPNPPKDNPLVPAKRSLNPPTLEEAHSEWLRYHRAPVEVIDPDLSHAGQFVAFFDGKPHGYDPDPTELRKRTADALNVHPNRLVISYLG